MHASAGHSSPAVARLNVRLNRREMGRQPWVVYGLLPTFSGAQLPALEQGVFGTLLVTSLYISLAFLLARLALRLIRRAPQCTVRSRILVAPDLRFKAAPQLSSETSVSICYVVGQ